jgi:hypothetical protein
MKLLTRLLAVLLVAVVVMVEVQPAAARGRLFRGRRTPATPVSATTSQPAQKDSDKAQPGTSSAAPSGQKNAGGQAKDESQPAKDATAASDNKSSGQPVRTARRGLFNRRRA